MSSAYYNIHVWRGGKHAAPCHLLYFPDELIIFEIIKIIRQAHRMFLCMQTQPLIWAHSGSCKRSVFPTWVSQSFYLYTHYTSHSFVLSCRDWESQQASWTGELNCGYFPWLLCVHYRNFRTIFCFYMQASKTGSRFHFFVFGLGFMLFSYSWCGHWIQPDDAL